ncbi:hypothetical protein LRR18_03750 [Mangrovimonas sp. AS39]|nr:hypothetical protein [Mangrovimonas futianensis]MCF1190688.1 hypothetical protein [Mangrovimonas futianensis]MCF1194385.1 hypothetical protein [Mangrovimonas futianensis]
METHIQIIGIFLVLLALVHLIFPKYFGWKTELQKLELINKQLMVVHTFFIALVVFLIGILCIFYSYELTNTYFGKTIALGLGIFWFIRLLFQLLVYSPKLWRGKSFETVVHIFFIIMWTYMSSSFALTYYY